MTETVLRIPTIETERLRLRAPLPSDYSTYASFRMSPRSDYAGGPFTAEQAFGQFCALTGHWAMRGYGRWIVAERESDRPIGLVGLFYPEGWLEPEIAWALFSAAHEGKGFAAEAALATRRYAYDVLGWITVVSLVSPQNESSAALATRMGAVREGIYHHVSLGAMDVWRHPAPQSANAGGV